MTNFETRKIMWATISRIFTDCGDVSFVWIFSAEDMDEANRLPDGTSYNSIGVSKWVDTP